jgi:hypothetical protein
VQVFRDAVVETRAFVTSRLQNLEMNLSMNLSKESEDMKRSIAALYDLVKSKFPMSLVTVYADLVKHHKMQAQKSSLLVSCPSIRARDLQ